VEVLSALGQALEGDADADLRDFTQEASQQLARTAREQAEARQAAGQPGAVPAAEEAAAAQQDAAAPGASAAVEAAVPG
jgi:hypothetical protein